MSRGEAILARARCSLASGRGQRAVEKATCFSYTHAWHTCVKGHNPYKCFGLDDVVCCDTFWLDKSVSPGKENLCVEEAAALPYGVVW